MKVEDTVTSIFFSMSIGMNYVSLISYEKIELAINLYTSMVLPM